MDLNVNNIETGMEVYDSAGEKIGSISEVYRHVGDLGSTQSTADTNLVVEEVEVIDDTPDYNSPQGVQAYDPAGVASAGYTGTADSSGAIDSGWTAGGTTGSEMGTTGTAYGSPPGSSSMSDYSTAPTGAGDTGGYSTADTSVNTITPPYGEVGIPHASGGGYFKVHQGGILGIGGHDLYIPFNVVQDIDPGNCVSLTCSKAEADSMYTTMPEFLDESS
jgi:hypothetical protein